MWTRRDEDDQRHSAPPPQQPSYNSKPNSGSYVPPVTPAVEPARGLAVLGKSVVLRGDIVADEDIHIDGDVEGTIRVEAHRLTIGPTGKVKANIKAREVTIRGAVQGNVETSDKILIYKDGTLVGDIKTAGIVIEDGAYFKGTIDILRPGVQKPAAAQTPSPKPQ